MCTFKTFGITFLIFGQLCDKKTCAFDTLGIRKKVVWPGGGIGRGPHSLLSES